MRARMRGLVCAMLVLPMCAAGHVGAASGAEIKLQMKGGGFEVSGELKQFDGAHYVIDSTTFGSMTLDATRFDCVGSNCPKAPVRAAYRAGMGDLGTTTWVGGSGIGTNYMPELVKSYAASVGLSVTQSVDTDARNLILKLTDAGGRVVGQVNINRQGVPPGIAALAQGKADVVWTSARVTPEDQAPYAASLGDLRAEGNEHVFALDAMVVLVAKENPLASISIDNLAKIYAGKISDWSELGLPAGKITVYAPVEGMGTWTHFVNTILKPRNLQVTPDAVRLKTVLDWSDRVAADPTGISSNFIAYIRNAKVLNVEDSCGLVTRPSLFTAKTEEYPLSRRLYLYSKGQPKTPLARELLAHALSQASQRVLRNADFVDHTPEALDFKQQTSRIAYALNAKGEDFDMELMRSLIGEIKPAKRLSITFRFDSSSVTLDSKSLADVGRLRDLLLTPEYAGKTLMLIGFADTAGPFANNLKLAERRAASVAKALAKASGGKIPAEQTVLRSYGELAPVACNDTFEARSLNRRVEVWIK